MYQGLFNTPDKTNEEDSNELTMILFEATRKAQNDIMKEYERRNQQEVKPILRLDITQAKKDIQGLFSIFND